jgi:hypothetical protein
VPLRGGPAQHRVMITARDGQSRSGDLPPQQLPSPLTLIPLATVEKCPAGPHACQRDASPVLLGGPSLGFDVASMLNAATTAA